MTDFAQALTLVFAGMALGWTAMFAFLIEPQAFRDLDYGRANRFVRTTLRSGNPVMAAFAGLAALCALAAGAFGAAAVLALAAGVYLLARWAVAPRTDGRAVGVRRKLQAQRILAVALTGMLLIAVAAGAGMAALSV